MIIYVNSIDFKGSLVNGPGIRSLLFLQGCDRHCEGCHNTSTWDIHEGKGYDVKELAAILKKNCFNGKLTITGGEPLYQMDALIELLKELEGIDICLYTSYEFEEVPNEVRKRINSLKTGKYDKKYRTTTTPYYGSTNQKFTIIKEE